MRGNATQTRVHYKGKEDDFVVIVESKEAVQNWKTDKSIPLAQVVDGWKIFITHKYVSHTSCITARANGGSLAARLLCLL